MFFKSDWWDNLEVPLVSLSLTTCGRISWCTYPQIKNYHARVTASAGCVALCRLPGFSTPVLNVNSLFPFILRER